MSYDKSGALGRSGAIDFAPRQGCWVLTGASVGIRLALEPTPPAPPHPTNIAPDQNEIERGESGAEEKDGAADLGAEVDRLKAEVVAAARYWLRNQNSEAPLASAVQDLERALAGRS